MKTKQKWRNFNLNDHIKVKLNENGRNIHFRNYLKEKAEYQASCGQIYPFEYQRFTEEDGWSTWQAWEFMEIFGSSLGQGKNEIVEMEIKIEI